MRIELKGPSDCANVSFSAKVFVDLMNLAKMYTNIKADDERTNRIEGGNISQIIAEDKKLIDF